MNAAVSLDLDNKWTYLMTHGDLSWKGYPSYLNLAIPRILEVLDQLGIKSTFFIVGKDAALEENRGVLESIVRSGHQVGNHSLNHEPWLHRYSEDQISSELRQAHELIFEVTGANPIGFRGPGFSLSAATLKVLHELDYIYDASTFPTFIGPLARLYYFTNANLGGAERAEREKLFGNLSEGFRPIEPYYWNVGSGQILEIPVTTLPILRVPFHLSYVLYLSRYSTILARAYFRAALAFCKAFRIEPSLLLHTLDFLGAEEVADLTFFPGMDICAADKLNITRWTLEYYAKEFTVYSLDDYAQQILINERETIAGARIWES